MPTRGIAIVNPHVEVPEGKYYVIVVDEFKNDEWLAGIFDTEEEAIKACKAWSGKRKTVSAYNHKGQNIFTQ